MARLYVREETNFPGLEYVSFFQQLQKTDFVVPFIFHLWEMYSSFFSPCRHLQIFTESDLQCTSMHVYSEINPINCNEAYFQVSIHRTAASIVSILFLTR